MIPVANEARLVLANTADLNNAACIVTCWAGTAKAQDVRIENMGPSFALVVDKTWCSTQGALKFQGALPDMCPLTAVQTVPTPVDPCQGTTCASGPVFDVDASANPVQVNITAPTTAGARFTVYWGTGYLPTKDVAVDNPVGNTYAQPGNYQIRVQDQATGLFGKPVWIGVTKVPNTITVTCPADQTTQMGKPVTPVTASAAGTNPSVTSYAWTASGLPNGLAIAGAGASATISGTPTAERTAAQGTVTVTATDTYGNTANCSFKWAVTADTTVTITKPSAQTNAIGDTVSLQLAAVDSNPDITTFTWTASGLPAGLSLNEGTGIISGTTTAGQAAADVTITATDTHMATDTATFKWTVTTAVTVAAISDVTPTTGAAVTVTPTATDTDGSITSFAWTVSPALPSSLAMAGATGKITGSVDKAQAKTPYTVTATDKLGAAGSKTFNITAANKVTVASVTDQTWTNGTAITNLTPSATDTDGTITTFTWTISPPLPDGVTLAASTGVISGTPTAAAAKTLYTLTATDSTTAAGTATFNITVA